MNDANSGEGWFEWLKMPENTTEIAYVHENGDVFDPFRGWNPIEFTIAAAEGRVFRLVRAETEPNAAQMDAAFNAFADATSSKVWPTRRAIRAALRAAWRVPA